MTAQEIMDAKALAASKSHSEVERRRRERINTHQAKLCSLLPSTTTVSSLTTKKQENTRFLHACNMSCFNLFNLLIFFTFLLNIYLDLFDSKISFQCYIFF
uniref:BHLH domain-containing protein n=1 Tax=Nelumbo nucifera TaxID=4432 RepID=A0A822ZKR3_NELNU|nr:TPA_asm: hypothetical protein HUJ06_016601 [Nelumbo nucifera]